MKRFVPVLCIILTVCTLMGTISFNVFAEAVPEITVNNYTVQITEADSIKDMRYALGSYTTTAEIRTAEGNVALSNAIVQKNTSNGIFTYEMPDGGYYTIWIRMTDGTNHILPLDLTSFVPKVSTYGVKITVDGLYDTKDVFIAKGEYQSYNEIKAAGYIVRLTPTKMAGKHSYTYTVSEPGMHTVLVRYNDGSEHIFHEILTVDEPVFVTNGLQVTVKNIPDIKVIRTAYGEYYTPGDTKRAPGARNFSNKSVIKDAEEYMLQYREEGIVTIVVEYNNGYIKVFHYNVQKKTPAVSQDGNTVTFGDLDGLVMVRYAEGVYASSSEIKKSPDSKVLKSDAIENGAITVTLTEGVYTFCVQYDDDSYNYYTITVEPDEPTATGIHISRAFNSDMVLQRDEPLSVWGTADPSSGKVRVDFGGEYAIGEVDSLGNWKATFKDTFSYTTEGQSLVVYGADESIELKNVLVGDMYFLIGQSNVYYSMAHLISELDVLGTLDQFKVDYNDERNIRFFRVSSTDYQHLTGSEAQGTTTLFADIYNNGYWWKPSDIEAQINTLFGSLGIPNADDSKVYSALGYMFAYNMSEDSDIPVGVIEIDASGSPLISFTPNELADKWGHDVLGADGTYHYKVGHLETDTKTRFVYNQQIYPFTNFSTAGILWYQGESDYINIREIFGAPYSNTYSDQFAELMTYFRSTFGNSDFPVYIIELPPCYSNDGNNAFIDMGGVRTEMGTIPQKLDNCYFVSSSDLWFNTFWWNNIHPPIKHLNARRLTDIVLAHKFGEKNIDDVCGPVLADVNYVSSSKAYLTFDHVGEGLSTADGSGYVTGLEIFIMYNGEGVWLEHEGKIITGTNQITVDAGALTLLGVRYGRATEDNHPNNRNLCNSYKMPAIAFVDYNVKESIEPATDDSGGISILPTE